MVLFDERSRHCLTEIESAATEFPIGEFEATGSRRYHYALLTTLIEIGPVARLIGRHIRIARSDIVAALNDLAERGLIECTSDPSDRHRNIGTITETGTRHLDELDRRIEGAQEELTAALSSAERANSSGCSLGSSMIMCKGDRAPIAAGRG